MKCAARELGSGESPLLLHPPFALVDIARGFLPTFRDEKGFLFGAGWGAGLRDGQRGGLAMLSRAES